MQVTQSSSQRSLELPTRLPTVQAKTVGLHPLLYRKRIERADRDVQPGDLVEVTDGDGNAAGYGLYNPKAELALRMLAGPGELPDEAFWRRKLTAAVELRRQVLRLNEVTDAYRLVHAEADGLSGLVIDKLGDVLSAECFAAGMYQRAEAILRELISILDAGQTATTGRGFVGSATAGRGYAWTIRPGPASLAQEGFEGAELSSPDRPA